MKTRREFLQDALKLTGCSVLGGCATWNQSVDMNKSYLLPVKDTVKKFHHDCLIVDLHSDTLLWHDLFGYDLLKKHVNPFPLRPLLGHVDVPRLKEGGVDLQFFSIVTNYWFKPFRNAYEDALALDKIVKQSEDLMWATNYASVLNAYSLGKIGVVLGMEGAHPLEGKLENLDYFYNAGLRYVGLTHFNDTAAAYSSWDCSNKNMRLTQFGRELLAHMDELGVLVDLAHINYRGFFDAIECTKNPVIVSHTGIRACLDDPKRNIDDAQIRAVAASGGVIGIMYHPYFINGTLRCKIQDVVHHMNHVRDMVGVDYIALGSDFDGFITLPTELRDVSDLPVLTQTLFDFGYTENEVKKVLGGNFMRVYKQVCK